MSAEQLTEVERLQAELSESEREHDKSLAIMEAALDDRDRWKQAYEMADPLLTERDRLAATLDQVREMADTAPPLMTKSGYVAGIVSASALRAAIEGTDS